MDIFGEPLLYKPQHSIFLNKLKIPLGVDANNIVSVTQQHTWRLSLTDEDLDGYRKEEELLYAHSAPGLELGVIS